jgi:RNA-directed DNA polymerase
VLAFCKKLGQVLSNMKANNQEEVINKLNPLLSGFANYYRGVVSKETFSDINHRVWQYLWRWALRRHLNKNKKWVKNRYCKRYRGNEWTFMCQGTGRKGKEKSYTLIVGICRREAAIKLALMKLTQII